MHAREAAHATKKGGCGLSSPSGNRRFCADSGPDPGGNIFRILILAQRAARKITRAKLSIIIKAHAEATIC